MTPTPAGRIQPGAKLMTVRGTLAAFVIACSLAIPAAVSAAIVEKWHTDPAVHYELMTRGDKNGDGTYDLITHEASGTIAVRSGATGALIAQTTLADTVNGMWFQDLDNDGVPEIIVWDISGKRTCFNWTAGSSTLPVRWSSRAFKWPTDMAFVDFDGNGKLYTVFMPSDSSWFYVYDSNGQLVSAMTLTPTLLGAKSEMIVGDFDRDEKEDLLIDFPEEHLLWLYQSGSAVGAEPGLPIALALSPSYPNPMFRLSRVQYSMPSAGPASLILFDVLGREIRTLVDGQMPAGRHEAIWDGRDAHGREVPAGTYFYQLNAAGQHQTQRIVRLR